MNFVPKSEKIFQSSAVLLLILGAAVVGAAGQKKTSTPAPKPSAPHASAPVAHPSDKPSFHLSLYCWNSLAH